MPRVDKNRYPSNDPIKNVKISSDRNSTKVNYFTLEEQSFNPKWQKISKDKHADAGQTSFDHHTNS